MEYTLLLAAFIIYTISFVIGLLQKRQLSLYGMYLGFLLHFGVLIYRSVAAHHPPFTNVYESLLLLSWLMLLKFLFFTKQINIRIIHFQRFIILVFTLIPILMSPEIRAIHPVMPALNSIWMYIHVPAYLFAYVALFSGFIQALIQLLMKKSIFRYEKQMDTDISLAMMFLSIGMITGAIWGQISWGNYWSWDPKETWALINILVLSLYFYKHDRIVQSIIVIIAALTVLFTYFGVSWLLTGLHSY